MAQKMTMDQAIKRAKELIAIQLESCSKEDWPYTCHMGSTPEGKRALEEMVIQQMMTSKCTVGQAFDRIERSYNPNRMED